MNHWSKRCINLHGNISTLEANRVAYLIAVNMNTNKRTIYKFDFHFFIASFKCDLTLRLALSSLLHFFNNKFHFGSIERSVWLRAPVANGVSYTLNKLTSNTNDDTLSL